MRSSSLYSLAIALFSCSISISVIAISNRLKISDNFYQNKTHSGCYKKVHHDSSVTGFCLDKSVVQTENSKIVERIVFQARSFMLKKKCFNDSKAPVGCKICMMLPEIKKKPKCKLRPS